MKRQKKDMKWNWKWQQSVSRCVCCHFQLHFTSTFLLFYSILVTGLLTRVFIPSPTDGQSWIIQVVELDKKSTTAVDLLVFPHPARGSVTDAAAAINLVWVLFVISFSGLDQKTQWQCETVPFICKVSARCSHLHFYVNDALGLIFFFFFLA